MTYDNAPYPYYCDIRLSVFFKIVVTSRLSNKAYLIDIPEKVSLRR